MRLTGAQLAEFHTEGFLILTGLFSAEEVAILRSELPRLFAEATPANIGEKASGEVRTAMGLHLRSPAYDRLCRHPRFVEPARQILGTDRLYIQQAKINAKVAFSGEAWQWHYGPGGPVPWLEGPPGPRGGRQSRSAACSVRRRPGSQPVAPELTWRARGAMIDGGVRAAGRSAAPRGGRGRTG